MADYKVDRTLLASFSTEEIIRILEDEADDYTPEAIKVFQEILESRGVTDDKEPRVATGQESASFRTAHPQPGNAQIRRPGDAVRMLNSLLNGVLNGTMDPQVAQVAGGLVMGILKAMEQEYMQGSGEE
jgi:hypothetical protein